MAYFQIFGGSTAFDENQHFADFMLPGKILGLQKNVNYWGIKTIPTSIIRYSVLDFQSLGVNLEIFRI